MQLRPSDQAFFLFFNFIKKSVGKRAKFWYNRDGVSIDEGTKGEKTWKIGM